MRNSLIKISGSPRTTLFQPSAQQNQMLIANKIHNCAKQLLVKSGAGFSLIELIVALAIFAILASGVIFVVVNSYRNFYNSGNRQTVADFAQEGLEAVNAIARNSWKDIESAIGANRGVAINPSTGKWEFAGSSNIQGDLTRVINVLNVSRTDGNISEAGATNDFMTKRVTVTVSAPGISSFILASYITNWNFSTWEQTNWNSGGGYKFWGIRTAYDSSTTITATATPGEIKLTSFKGTYDASGILYSSGFPITDTDKKLYQLRIHQNIPSLCSNSIMLELSAKSDFSSPVQQTFTSASSYYTSQVTANTNGMYWARFKITMNACNTNKSTPILYSMQLFYH